MFDPTMVANEILRLHASYYFSLGFNVTCLSIVEINNFNAIRPLKSPNHEWESLKERRQQFSELMEYSWERATGIGAVLGHNDFRVIDVDGCKDQSFLNSLLNLLKLPTDYEWVIITGSQNGYHIYVRAQDHGFVTAPGKTRGFLPNPKHKGIFRQIELRWEDHVVLPPSIHRSNQRYEFADGHLPRSNPATIQLIDLYRFIDMVAAKSPSEVQFDAEGLILVEQDSNEVPSLDVESIERDELIFRYLTQNKNRFLDALASNEFVDFQDYYIPVDARADESASYSRPYFLFFDTETNGLPPRDRKKVPASNDWPRLVQLAWLLVDASGKRIREATAIVKPEGFSIAIESTRIHRISTASALRDGKMLTEVLLSFEQSVWEADFIVAHNFNFDSNVIAAEFNRKHLVTALLKKTRVCTMEGSKEFCGIKNEYGYKWPTLSELHLKLFRREFEEAHNAAVDVLATEKCFWELRRLRIL